MSIFVKAPPRLALLLLAIAALAGPASAQELGIPQASDGARAIARERVAKPGATTFLMAGVTAASPGTVSLFSSSDGVEFTSLASEAFRPPAGLPRDLAIARGTDGWYRMLYAGDGGKAGVTRSRDLKRWEPPRELPLHGTPRWLRERDGSLKAIVSLADGYALLDPDPALARWSAPQPLRGLALKDAVVAPGDGGYVALGTDAATGLPAQATAPAPTGPWTVTAAHPSWNKAWRVQSLVRPADGAWRVYLLDPDSGRSWHADSADLRTWRAPAELKGVSGAVRQAAIVAEDRGLLAQATRPAGKPKTVTWDQHSLLIDGRRVVLWSGEIHPFRLPNPSLWRDVIQKMKALGFNGVAFYFDWGYHSPAPGVYDFSHVRNVERALEIAEEEGMYIIARTGPYVNAELTGGGYPGWMLRNRAEARTDDPVYLAAVDEWMTQINAIVARHQVTTGGGNVIAYQLENELGKVEPKHVRQMEHLAAKARADGITVPFFHNAAGRLPDWTPKASSAPWANPGPTDLYAFDGYPGGTCDVHADPAGPNRAPDWGLYGNGSPKTGALSSPGTPGFAAELGGGWFDYWGSNGTYACTAERQGKGYQRVFYGTNLINRITIHNIYMTFGGTSWGWLPGPVVYTSYDYGAPISEDRGLRPKALALKQQGMFVQAAEKALAQMDKGPPIATSSSRAKVYHNVNPALGAHILFAVHSPSNLTSDDSFTFALATKSGHFDVPLRLNGQDAKMLLAEYPLERQHLVYSTSELQTHLQDGERDIALLHGRTGEAGETVLRYASAPRVEVLAGKVTQRWDGKAGLLKLDYRHDGMARVRITGGGRAPLLLLLADEGHSVQFWTQDTPAGRLLQLSSALVRGATLAGDELRLRGDSSETARLEIWGAPARAARTVSFNGVPLAATPQPDGSVSTAAIAAPAAVTLPALARWARRMDSLEARPEFDDALWARVDARASAAQTWTMPERGQPTLAMSDYGFHHGDVWYRGRVDIRDGRTDQLELFYGAGGAGMIQVWVDGRFVGQHELDVGRQFPETTDSVRFALGPLAPGPHVIAVMVRNNSHNWDLMADDAHREARGLIAASLTSKGGRRFAVPIVWRIQGNQGGEDIADVVRGPMNNGGLLGERQGWYLPALPDAARDGWLAAKVTDAPPAPGTYWLRTSFELDLPRGHDVQLGLAFGDTARPRSERENRALIFVNGWNMGQFIAHVGPQRTFVIPPGILNPNGANTIALAVTTDGQAGNALEPVRLVTLRAARGGVPLELMPGAAPRQ
ncbi:beta-galactosidase [Pseudoduganella buxea]|nr:beta-galactosidase [Pseudoduganella buxea]MTV53795.1 beta-galactosidase [Pseudoduganella buxea]